MIPARTIVALTVGLCVLAPASLLMASEISRDKLERIAALGKMVLREWRYCPPGVEGGPNVGLDDSGWATVDPGFEWIGENSTVWFRKTVAVPERVGGIKSRGCRLIFRAGVDDDGEIYVNGELENKFHWDEGEAVLSEKAEPGDQFRVAVRGMNKGGRGRLLNASLELVLDPGDTSLGTRYVRTVKLLEAVSNRFTAAAEARAIRKAVAASLDHVPDDVLDAGDRAAIVACLQEASTVLEPVLRVLKRYTVHMIANAHIDSAWLWRWLETVEVCKATYRSALDIMNDYPDFTFACSSAAHYFWMEQHAPEIFEKIRERVKEGRWEIVGGWWVQSDVNIPSGESFVRQALYGQRYFWRKFGKIATVGYNPDSFGHTGTLPQILAKCGLDGYLFFRPGPHEKELPVMFWWEAPDGTRVLASRPPHHYGFSGGQAATAERIERAFHLMPDGVTDVLCFYGVGDHGGGPTRETVGAITELSREPAMPGIKFGNVEDFYERVRQGDVNLPVVRDELQHHASGCYAVHSAVKRRNKKCEELLLTAERIASFASTVAGVSYDTGEMEQAWRHVLFNQFHDILAGTSIAPVYDDADEMYDEAERIASGILRRALNAIVERINTEGDGQAIVVFNPLAWDRKGPVEIEIPWRHKPESLEVRDADGNVVPVQRVRTEMPAKPGRMKIVFVVDVPSLGYRVYHCVPVVAGHLSSRPSASETGRPALENVFWRVEIDPRTGAISRLFDKTARVDVFSGSANVPVVMRDMSDTWSHGVFEFHDEIGRFGDARVSVIERGPVRTVARIESRYGQSVVWQDLILYGDVPVIECRTTVDWHEQRKLLKLAFPVNVVNPVATYQIPYGYIERPVNGEEEPAQQWIDVTGTLKGRAGKKRTYGVSLLNDCKYSFDVLDGTMSMTILRSPPYALHDPRKEEPDHIYEYIDQGVQHLAYSLVPHEGSWRDAGTVRRAAELNAPLIAVATGNHAGELPRQLSFITAEPDNVALTVVKRSEDSADLILRLYETTGKTAECTVNMVTSSASWTGKLVPNEIKTLKVSATETELRFVETDMLEGLAVRG